MKRPLVPTHLALAGLTAVAAVAAGCAGMSSVTPALGAASGAAVAAHARSVGALRPAAASDEALFISDTAGGAGNGFVVRTTSPYSNYQTIDKDLDQNGAIAVDAKDDLIVADVGASKVLIYPSPYTGTPEKIGTDIAFPSALALNSKQTLFIANAATNSVAYVDSPYTGTVKRLLDGIAAPFALAVDGSDDLFIANAPHSGIGGNVVEYAYPYAGSPKRMTTGIGLPRALAVDAKGNLFVASYAGPGQVADIAIFAPPYTGKPTIVTDKVTAPIAIALAPDGTLFVANAPSNGGYGKRNIGNIAVFASPYAAAPRLITARVNTPQALLVDGSGTLFAAMRGGDDGYGYVGELKSPYTGTFTEIKNPADLPSALAVAPPVPQPSDAPQTIGLSPSIALPNAASGKGSAADIAVPLSEIDASGQTISGTYAVPISVSVYGPSGVISQMSATLSSSSAAAAFKLRYTGAAFKNPLTLVATAENASSVASLVPSNHPACSVYTMDKSANVNDRGASKNFKDGFDVRASIGGGKTRTIELDTGSEGLVVGSNAIGPDAIGPGAPGLQEYTSDGLILTGYYYLAKVTFETTSGTIETVPMEVLGVSGQMCAPYATHCSQKTPQQIQNVSVMGIGFDRGTGAGHPTPAPYAASPFTQLTDVVEGTMTPGYRFDADRVRVGVTPSDRSDFTGHTQALLPNPAVAADWKTESGCYSFPKTAATQVYCGTVLMDTGISTAIFSSESPPPSLVHQVGNTKYLPNGTAVKITVPSDTTGINALDLTYTLEAPPNPNASAPGTARWSKGSYFVNTGRNVLRRHDYLYDNGCGIVGFRDVR